MAMNIKFDLVGNPEPPTIILANRNGNKLGQLNVNEKTIDLTGRLNDASEFTFTLNKYIDDELNNLWDKVVDFKLVYCKEWDTWFEITVELDEATETVKTAFCTQLGQAELSQLMLYNIEINTEDDIARDDYKITILYDNEDHEASLLHRLLRDKAPHYSIAHIDPTITEIQRTFSFDGTSIYDALLEVGEEIGCLFLFPSNSDANGNIQRTIAVYDLESNCRGCGHRGEFTSVCPECGSTNIIEGYGKDTTIFITADELADNIQLVTDTDSVKNCFKLEAGDDLMTATIRNCNPNGTDYLWYISDAVKQDMSPELVEKLEEYDEDYVHYQNEYVINLNSETLESYNALVKKYQTYNEDLEEIDSTIIGYPSLMQAYYNTVDLELYLESSLMPPIETSETDVEKEARKLIRNNISPVSVENVEYVSEATASNVILAMAKILVDSRYRVKIYESSFDKNTKIWSGNFKITDYSDEDKFAISSTITVDINGDYENFVKQKIEKALNKENTDDLSITGLFKKQNNEFSNELKKYSLNCLTSFHNACQGCIDILIEQGVGNKETWSGKDPNLYDKLYVAYRDKIEAIDAETKLRQEELDLITGTYDIEGSLKSHGLQTYIEEAQNYIHNQLDFENYLGNNLWLEFCSFRREDKYSNNNYISDGLNNAELFDNALKFIEVAEKEIFKSAELQHSISTTLKNLLAIDKFKPLVEKFELGNWLRILVDDEIYKLRLIEYTISYGDFNNISVEFSDVVKNNSTIKSIQDVIDQASKMATSYDAVQKQAEKGNDSNKILDGWSQKGLDVTNTKIIQGANNQTQTWDSHGMLFRKYDEATEDYEDTQLKIVNSTMAITNDKWQTVKTAIGEFYYFDPVTKELKKAYGVNGEVLVGQLILGEQLGIYNSSNSMTFNNNGLQISNGTNTFVVNPNEDMLLRLSRKTEVKDENENYIETWENIFYVDSNGKLHVQGDGSGLDIAGNATFTGLKGDFTDLKDDFIGLENGLLSGTTIIDGGCIKTGKISAGVIDAENLEVKGANVTGTLTSANISADRLTAGTINASNITLNGYSLSNFTNNMGYQNSSGVKSIVTKTVDADYINAFSIEADTIKGGTIYVKNSSGETTAYIYPGATTAAGLDITSKGNLFMRSGDGTYVYVNTSKEIIAGAGGGALRPSGTTTNLGTSSYAWSNIYSSTGEIKQSDRNLKNNIEELPNKYITLFDNITPKRFKMNDGTSNRYHVGYIAQEVEEAMDIAGIDSKEFGGFIRDYIVDEDGNKTDEEILMLRYGEFDAIYAAKIKQIESRLNKLESIEAK